LDRLKSLGREELVQTIPTITPDVTLSSLLDQLNAAEQALIIKKTDYGPEHTENLKLQAQIKDLRDRINRRMDGIMGALDAKVASQKQMLDNLEDEVQKALDTDLQKAKESRPYFDAKRNLEGLQRSYQILATRIASERVDSQLPRTAQVEIIDRAVPPLRPASPNLPRAAATIAFGLLMSLVGLGMVRGAARYRGRGWKVAKRLECARLARVFDDPRRWIAGASSAHSKRFARFGRNITSRAWRCPGGGVQ